MIQKNTKRKITKKKEEKIIFGFILCAHAVSRSILGSGIVKTGLILS